MARLADTLFNFLAPALTGANDVYQDVTAKREKKATEEAERKRQERLALIEEAALNLKLNPPAPKPFDPATDPDAQRMRWEWENKPKDTPTPPNWTEVTTNEGVFMVNPRNPQERERVGDRPAPQSSGGGAGDGEVGTWTTVNIGGRMARVNNKTNETQWLPNPDGGEARPPVSASTQRLRVGAAANRRAISEIGQTISLLQQRPQSVGGSRGVSDWLDQRIDQAGVEARSAVAKIGAMVVHDLSGAAVSPSEWSRLAPFIPTARDTARAAITKLQRMATELQNAAVDMEEISSFGGGSQSIPQFEGNPY